MSTYVDKLLTMNKQQNKDLNSSSNPEQFSKTTMNKQQNKDLNSSPNKEQ